MKIVFITNLYEPYVRGGAEIIVKRTALEMMKQGHDVSVITAKPWSGFSSLRPKEETVDGVKIIRYYPLNLFFYKNDHKWPFPFRLIWHFFDLFNLTSAYKVKTALIKEKPDLVITHNLIGLGFFIPGVIKRLKIKHIHVLHDIQLAVRSGVMKKGQEKSWFVTGPIARIYQKIVKSLFGSPDMIVSPSQFLLDFYKKLQYFPESKKMLVRNPIDQRFFAWESTKEESQDQQKLVHFGYVGQLAEHKGLKTLKRAFTSISEPNLRLIIVGSGPIEEEIRDWAKHDVRVDFRGQVPNEELPKFYQSIDVTILPTETYENSPTVVFESLASGRPVIVSSIGGAAEVIEEGKNGFVFEPVDTKGLIDAIKKSVTNHFSLREACVRSVEELGQEEYVDQMLNNIV